MAPFKALSACYTVFMMNLQSWILFSGRLVLLFKHFHTGVDCVLSLIVRKEGPHGKPGMFEVSYNDSFLPKQMLWKSEVQSKLMQTLGTVNWPVTLCHTCQ